MSEDQEAKHMGPGWTPPVQITPKEQVPSIGRIVFYHTFGTPKGEYKSKAVAAIITQVNDDGSCGLCVFNPTGLFFNTIVPYDSGLAPGTWSWPPRV
jgi:hypothetical protein